MEEEYKRPTRFKKFFPVMIYISLEDKEGLKKYSFKTGMNTSEIAREGIRMRLAGSEDPYNRGFNEGLKAAMDIVNKVDGAKMMFPSGLSFAKLVCDGIEKFMRERYD